MWWVGGGWVRGACPVIVTVPMCVLLVEITHREAAVAGDSCRKGRNFLAGRGYWQRLQRGSLSLSILQRGH